MRRRLPLLELLERPRLLELRLALWLLLLARFRFAAAGAGRGLVCRRAWGRLRLCMSRLGWALRARGALRWLLLGAARASRGAALRAAVWRRRLSFRVTWLRGGAKADLLR